MEPKNTEPRRPPVTEMAMGAQRGRRWSARRNGRLAPAGIEIRVGRGVVEHGRQRAAGKYKSQRARESEFLPVRREIAERRLMVRKMPAKSQATSLYSGKRKVVFRVAPPVGVRRQLCGGRAEHLLVARRDRRGGLPARKSFFLRESYGSARPPQARRLTPPEVARGKPLFVWPIKEVAWLFARHLF